MQAGTRAEEIDVSSLRAPQSPQTWLDRWQMHTLLAGWLVVVLAAVIAGEWDATGSFIGPHVLGWVAPDWTGLARLFLVIGTLAHLVLGPQPWRATRWAWFWLFGVLSPLGMIAFLVLSGPTPGVRTPRSGARRLTGGWAFLLALVLGSVSLW